ncbi:MAG: hypothetical protein RLZ98_1184 [Pseudomonadota bacterium]|jgi:predicted cupin superfamily sugar epimerase
MPTASQLIRMLRLEPHPEGGHFRETFRDEPGPGGRARSTAIYYLLQAGEVSNWHTVDAPEIWHWHAGAPLELSIAAPSASIRTNLLGPDVESGAEPQIVVPAGHWQSAVSLGEYSLVGCTVAPGFEFSGFHLAPVGFTPGRR